MSNDTTPFAELTRAEEAHHRIKGLARMLWAAAPVFADNPSDCEALRQYADMIERESGALWDAADAIYNGRA